MSKPQNRPASGLTNGPGAAAILSAGIGCFTLAVLAIIGDKYPAIKAMLVFYKPTGPLSGVTTLAIAVWISTWIALELLWRNRTVALTRVCLAAFTLLALGFLLTFPPIADWF